MTVHELKSIPEYFKAVLDGFKTFEVRKNDRGFKVGDELLLKEWYEEKGYSGREIVCVVQYILDTTEYCKEGYVVMAIKVLKWK
jgi:hypothetical protein